MLKKLILGSFCLITLTIQAQDYEPKSQFAKDFLPVWLSSVEHTKEVANAMPAELYQYQPNDSSKTFAGQIGHIAFTTLYLANAFAVDIQSPYEDPETKDMTKNELITYLSSQLDKATQAICAMTDEQVNDTVKVFGGKTAKRYVAVMFVQDHLANHRAKANLYIRMNDIKPPSYRFF
ncbi:MAG: hypothetical protein Tsb0034_16660 [Ekhidna sp.]